MDEQILIKQAQSGDTDAFEQLARLYGAQVYNFCCRMTNNTHDAEDIAQDVFIKIYGGIKKFKHRGEGSFRRWVYTVANNACTDALRKKKSRIRPDSLDAAIETEDGVLYNEPVSPESTPEETVLKKERQEILKQAIAELPAQFRQMIVLRDVRGLSYSDIAQITGNNPGTVKSKISRARACLREQLKK